MNTRRLFIAAYPPAELASELSARAHVLAPSARQTPLRQIHITLLFLGDTDDRQLAHIEESIERAATGLLIPDLAVQRLITLPDRGPPRLIAAETSAPAALLELHRRLLHRLARPSQRASERDFLPHLTLARFGPAGGPRVEESWANSPHIAFSLQNIQLVQSHLRPGGAEHHTIRVFATRPAETG